MKLILTMRLREGTEAPKARDKSIEYEVMDLPPGHQAIIALAYDGWQILHANDGFSGEWVGTYESAEAALAALQEALEED
jgi:hypothetical protein